MTTLSLTPSFRLYQFSDPTDRSLVLISVPNEDNAQYRAHGINAIPACVATAHILPIAPATLPQVKSLRVACLEMLPDLEEALFEQVIQLALPNGDSSQLRRLSPTEFIISAVQHGHTQYLLEDVSVSGNQPLREFIKYIEHLKLGQGLKVTEVAH